MHIENFKFCDRIVLCILICRPNIYCIEYVHYVFLLYGIFFVSVVVNFKRIIIWFCGRDGFVVNGVVCCVTIYIIVMVYFFFALCIYIG
jgi:hypothetical protein